MIVAARFSKFAGKGSKAQSPFRACESFHIGRVWSNESPRSHYLDAKSYGFHLQLAPGGRLGMRGYGRFLWHGFSTRVRKGLIPRRVLAVENQVSIPTS